MYIPQVFYTLKVEDWLDYFDVNYHEIAPKVQADIYLDDRGVTFKDWEQASAVLGLE